MVKLFDTTITNAALQALTVSHYYWLNRDGTLTDSGQATLAANVSATAPPASAIFDASPEQGVNLLAQHGALTSAVGGTIAAAVLTPDLAPPSGAPVVVGTPVSQTLAATAESVQAALVNPPTVVRGGQMALAILFTTVPTAGSTLRVSVWGARGFPQE